MATELCVMCIRHRSVAALWTYMCVMIWAKDNDKFRDKVISRHYFLQLNATDDSQMG